MHIGRKSPLPPELGRTPTPPGPVAPSDQIVVQTPRSRRLLGWAAPFAHHPLNRRVTRRHPRTCRITNYKTNSSSATIALFRMTDPSFHVLARAPLGPSRFRVESGDLSRSARHNHMNSYDYKTNPASSPRPVPHRGGTASPWEAKRPVNSLLASWRLTGSSARNRNLQNELIPRRPARARHPSRKN